jgi:hypothetical protein
LKLQLQSATARSLQGKSPTNTIPYVRAHGCTPGLTEEASSVGVSFYSSACFEISYCPFSDSFPFIERSSKTETRRMVGWTVSIITERVRGGDVGCVPRSQDGWLLKEKLARACREKNLVDPDPQSQLRVRAPSLTPDGPKILIYIYDADLSTPA